MHVGGLPNPTCLFFETVIDCFAVADEGKVVQLYKGAEGSIRSISCHRTEPVVAACGLDRFVRIYDVDTRQLLHKVRCCRRSACVVLYFVHVNKSLSVT